MIFLLNRFIVQRHSCFYSVIIVLILCSLLYIELVYYPFIFFSFILILQC